ncbi:hypothetical protein [Halomontanus rarus]|uniref:hypothetical protein n=1 Tax=Halomontanus rarus TaxID=3034020 RepID=UPI001A99594A
MTQNPFTAVFDAQRTAIEQSQSLTHDALEAQQTSFTAFADALAASENLVEQNAELTKGALHAYFDTVESNLPEEAADFDELRDLVDDGFDTATEAQLDSLDAAIEAVEESGTAYDEFAADYADVVDSSFDAYLDAHEQLETNVVAVAENVEDAADEFDASA